MISDHPKLDTRQGYSRKIAEKVSSERKIRESYGHQELGGPNPFQETMDAVKPHQAY
jgi:hypothetical protein